MTDIINIPLNKLTLWTGNVRKVRDKAGIDALAASIKAHGLQQNLVVRKEGKTFAVVAGGRRLKALQLLAKSGDIQQATHAVPCRITEAENATELSLAENVMRADMHPADQFEAFRALADDGLPVADIAARFGCSAGHIQKLLKLARVSPKIIKAYRNNSLTLECVMAFTVTDDHAAQEKVLAGFDAERNDARDIRAALTEGAIAATNKRVKFVTLKAYEKAGGALNRDLFSDSVYIEDTSLLERLVAEKLERKSASVRAEGWKWLEIIPDFGYQDSTGYKRIYPEPVPLTKSKQQNLDKLQAEYDALNDVWSESDAPDAPERLDELEQLISAIEDRDGIWAPEQKSIAGAVISIDYDGEIKIERGYVKPDDVPKQPKKVKTGEQPAGLSAALVESLTAHRSAALAATLLDAPDIGLATVVYALVLEIFSHRQDTVLEVSGKNQSLHRVEGSVAFQRLEQARENWGQRIPGTPDDIWTWCLEQDQAVLLDLLTFCAACTVNAVQRKPDRPDCARLEHARKLGGALALDMKAWFTPTADNYFSRVSKPQIFDALTAARKQPSAPAWEKLKKAELALLAERETAGTGWLPDILR